MELDTRSNYQLLSKNRTLIRTGHNKHAPGCSASVEQKSASTAKGHILHCKWFILLGGFSRSEGNNKRISQLAYQIPAKPPGEGVEGTFPDLPTWLSLSYPTLGEPAVPSVRTCASQMLVPTRLRRPSTAVEEPRSTPHTQGWQQLFLWWPRVKQRLLKQEVSQLGDPAIHDVQQPMWKHLTTVSKITLWRLPKVLKVY